jgi:hypothetical protein
MAELPLTWNIFLIRIWHETGGEMWRGQITHVPTHQIAYFDTLEQMQAFMAVYVSDIGRPHKPEDKPAAPAG